ncbi:MAG: NACHT domain-containing protein [Fimbriimonadaceae bacterium]
MSLKATSSVTEAVTQLRTAAATKVALLHNNTRVKPDYVYLCTSGAANTAARAHIAEELAGTNLTILDCAEIIGSIDQMFPSFWLNISRYNRRYVETVRSQLLAMSDAVLLHPGDTTIAPLAPISDQAYVTLTLFRLRTHLTVKQGIIKTEPQFEEITDVRLLDQSQALTFVIGEAGEGKTTFLRRLCLLTCDRSLAASGPEDCPLPVFFRAIDLIRADTVVEAIHQKVKEVLKESESGITDDDFKSGRIQLFVDAIDELGNSAGYVHVLNLLDEFTDSYPSCRVIATTRPLMTVRDHASAKQIPIYQISDFSLKQTARIVDRAVAGKDIQPNVLTEVLRRLQDVHGMKLNPMLVTVFAATPNFYSKDIPPNISAIFRKFAALMLGQWDEQKGVSRQYEWEEKHGILAQIALDWHNNRITERTEEQFRSAVGKILTGWGRGDRTNAVTDEILRSGLLIIVEDRVSFRHHLFQEYFTGASIESLNDIESVISDEWWRNAIIFAYGARPGRGDELAVLIRNVDLSQGARAYRSLVAIGLALQACYQTNVEIRQQILGELLLKLGECFAGFLRTQEGETPYPLNAFLFHFLEARDAVSSDQILNVSTGLVDESIAEHVEFLRLTGAIESGFIETVRADVLEFSPQDERLLLGLHLLAFFVIHLRVSSGLEKKTAKSIADTIAPKIQPLVSEVVREFKGIVMELQQGQLKVLDAPFVTPQGQYEIDFDAL